MNELMESVIKAVVEENIRASNEHGEFFNSDHESIGVILEEGEETREEYNRCSASFNKFWTAVKNDSEDEQKIELIRDVYHHALLTACECIQFAQTVFKACRTIENRRCDNDSNRS